MLAIIPNKKRNYLNRVENIKILVKRKKEYMRIIQMLLSLVAMIKHMIALNEKLTVCPSIVIAFSITLVNFSVSSSNTLLVYLFSNKAID